MAGEMWHKMLAVSSTPIRRNDPYGETDNRPMKTALAKIFGFVVGHDRSEKNNPTNRNYCICGALKPEVGARQSEASLKSKGRLQSMNSAGK
jgi:hypothetical protein